MWPSAPVLAQFVSFNRYLFAILDIQDITGISAKFVFYYISDQFVGKSVLELGSGTGIVGIVSAKAGAQTVITDSDKYDDCLELCRQNVDINGVKDNVKDIVALNWGQFDEQLIRMPAFDFILSSDCFYNENDFEDIVSSVSFLIDKHPERQTIFYTTYEERNSDWSIECLLDRWHLKCRYISLSDFEADSGLVGGTDLSDKHSIHLLKITKRLETQ